MHNVVVTTGQLVPTLAKLLLFRLAAAFPPESIYSARNQGKQHCFDLIRARFGAAARYCVIGAPPRLACLECLALARALCEEFLAMQGMGLRSRHALGVWGGPSSR